MHVLCDTSVLVAGMVSVHPRHSASFPWLARAREGHERLSIAAHSLAECYNVLTSLPVTPRIGPAYALRLITDDVVGCAQIVALTPAQYHGVIRDLAARGIQGGTVYDALILACARKAGVERLLTLNPRDFERVRREGDPVVMLP
jgi:predicted nucleic acid-binding protein